MFYTIYTQTKFLPDLTPHTVEGDETLSDEGTNTFSVFQDGELRLKLDLSTVRTIYLESETPFMRSPAAQQSVHGPFVSQSLN